LKSDCENPDIVTAVPRLMLAADTGCAKQPKTQSNDKLFFMM
jgi:hypothetical protein